MNSEWRRSTHRPISPNSVPSRCNKPSPPATNTPVNVNAPSQSELFDRLVQENRSRLWGIARSYGRDQASDLFQEILLQIWKAAPGFRSESSELTWCYRIALNIAISWQRKTSRRLQRESTAIIPEVAHRLDGESDEALLERFLTTLSAADKACLVMYLDDLGPAEIAAVLESTEGAVRTRLHRIKQKLADWEPLDS